MQVAEWPPHLRGLDPVLRALAGLFAALDWEDSEARLAGQQPDTRASVVRPNELREALSDLPGQLFKVGACRGKG